MKAEVTSSGDCADDTICRRALRSVFFFAPTGLASTKAAWFRHWLRQCWPPQSIDPDMLKRSSIIQRAHSREHCPYRVVFAPLRDEDKQKSPGFLAVHPEVDPILLKVAAGPLYLVHAETCSLQSDLEINRGAWHLIHSTLCSAALVFLCRPDLAPAFPPGVWSALHCRRNLFV